MQGRRRATALGAAFLAVSLAAVQAAARTPPQPASARLNPAPPAGLAAAPWHALAFATALHGWLVTQAPASPADMAVFGTTDGGRRWRLLDTHLDVPADAMGVAALAASGRAVEMAVSLGVGACQAWFLVLRSDDGGRTWRRAGTLLGSDGPTAVLALPEPLVVNGDCANPGIDLEAPVRGRWLPVGGLSGPRGALRGAGPTAVSAWAADRTVDVAAAYASGEAGAGPLLTFDTAPGPTGPWHAVPFGGAGIGGTVRALAVAGRRRGLAVAGKTSLRLYRLCADGGVWRAVPGVAIPPGAEVQLAWATAQVAYLAVSSPAGGALWRSVDGGVRWRRMAPRLYA
ncbi:MAG: hypothetical protein K6V73_01200 [Firmicutes bacterium]|nr:hypothetical protein [Bacillota bacterium]